MIDADTTPDPFALALADLRLAAAQMPAEAHAKLLDCALALWDAHHRTEVELAVLKEVTGEFARRALPALAAVERADAQYAALWADTLPLEPSSKVLPPEFGGKGNADERGERR